MNGSKDSSNTLQKMAIEETSLPKYRKLKARLFQWIVGLLVATFAVLTFLVVSIPTFKVDIHITHGLQAIHSSLFSALMHTISWIGYAPQTFIFPVLIILIIFVLGYQWEAIASLLAAITVGLLNIFVKDLVHRARPSADLVQVTHLLKSYSFPSGHVMFYTGFFGFMCFLCFILLKSSWIRSLLLLLFGGHVLLIGPSRIYLGAHWASDVAGAYLLGGLCLIGYIGLYRWGKPRFFNRQPVATPINSS